MANHSSQSAPKASDIWTIDGKKYDLRSFMQHHPGGMTALELGRGQDCSILFHSYHLNLTKESVHWKILASYEVSAAAEVKLAGGESEFSKGQSSSASPEQTESDSLLDDRLYQELKAEIHSFAHQRFKQPATKVLKIPASRTALAIFAIAVHLITLNLWLRTGWIGWGVLTAICNILAGLQLTHDGSHFAVSTIPWINDVATWVSLPFVYHPRFWYMQHVVQHHVYTNDSGDVDLIHLSPLGRLSPLMRWRWYYKFNEWVAAMFLPAMATFAESIQYPARLLLAFVRGDLNQSRMLAACSDKSQFLFGSSVKIMQYILALLLSVVPFAYSWYWFGYLNAMVPFLVTGVWFFVVTQVSHLQPECQDPNLEKVNPETGKKVLPWSHRQLLHTVDYQPNSILVNILSGGLNIQSLHHLFPTIHHSHFVELWPRLHAIAARHGVHIRTRTSVWHALATWFGWMEQLGKVKDSAKMVFRPICDRQSAQNSVLAG